MKYSDKVTSGTNGNNHDSNKLIKIKSGNPAVESATLVDNETLEITFDREVTKVSSNKEIVLAMDEAKFKAPVVLTESQYSDLSTLGIETYYEEGLNGATLQSDGTLKNDTATKHIQ